jgi:hypothetical protein
MVRLAAVLVLSSAASLLGQTPARDRSTPTGGTGVVRGRVVADATGEPIRKARVTLAGGATMHPATFSDDSGGFTFTDLPPGSYQVSARKAGYAPTTFGAQRPGTPSIRLEIADATTVIAELRMPRSGAISGRVVDEFGEPVERASVLALRLVRREGRTSTVVDASSTTDDRGEYRLGGLHAGRFVVGVMPPRTNLQMVTVSTAGGLQSLTTSDTLSAHIYYPGVPSLAQAQMLDVAAGEERSGTDVIVVSGRPAKLLLAFTDTKGNAVPATAMLANVSDSAEAIDSRSLPMSGMSIATTIEPGEWMIYATGSAGVGVARVSVGTEDVASTIVLSGSARIGGRVVAENGALPGAATVDVEAFCLDPALAAVTPPSVSRMRADGTFTFASLVGPRELRIRSMSVHGWIPKAILYNGRNLLDTAIDLKSGDDLSGVQIVLTNRTAALAGAVVDAHSASLADSSVLVFPGDRPLPRDLSRVVRWVRPDQTGRFIVDDLPPGEYLVVALPAVDDSQWLNADYFDRFRSIATPVTLGEGQKTSVALELRPAP